MKYFCIRVLYRTTNWRQMEAYML